MKFDFIAFLDKVRDFFEHATPSIFSVLAALLPYLSPLPIATLTASSAMLYLGMSGTIAGVFVFVLEGLGLWVTSALVDAIVDLIRSRNSKTAIMVGILTLIVFIYVAILINLNVRLKSAAGEISSEYSTIITLICFLPLISGFMNGYWKIRLQSKADIDLQKKIAEDREEKIRQEKRQDSLAKYKIKHGINPDMQPIHAETVAIAGLKPKFASEFHDEILEYLKKNYEKYGKVARVIEITAKFGLDYNKSKGYISDLRKKWMAENNITKE